MVGCDLSTAIAHGIQAPADVFLEDIYPTVFHTPVGDGVWLLWFDGKRSELRVTWGMCGANDEMIDCLCCLRVRNHRGFVAAMVRGVRGSIENTKTIADLCGGHNLLLTWHK